MLNRTIILFKKSRDVTVKLQVVYSPKMLFKKFRRCCIVGTKMLIEKTIDVTLYVLKRRSPVTTLQWPQEISTSGR